MRMWQNWRKEISLVSVKHMTESGVIGQQRGETEDENRTCLEGGAMRGIYTAGVLDVFLEQGIHFDGVNGVSAGALHGCSFVSGQKGRSLRYIKNIVTINIL